MHVFLTGATGLIGSAVLARLIKDGHRVTAMVHTAEKSADVRAAGATPLTADLAEPATYRAAIGAADATIHTGAVRDATKGAVDKAFVTTAVDILAGTGRTLIYTSGIWDYGSAADLTEQTPYAPVPLVAWRPALARQVRTAPGMRGIVLAPGMVHGDGAGIHNVLAARTDGAEPALRLVGSGRQHWAMVHRDDLAEAYALALTTPTKPTTLLAASGDNPTVYDIGVALSRAAGLDGRVVAEPDQASIDRIGPVATALLLDQQADGAHARTTLGWVPSRPTILNEITEG